MKTMAWIMNKLVLCLTLCFPLFIGTLTGCTASEEDLYGSISGSVVDEDTKNLLKGVSVSISPLGDTQVTNSDGTYSFKELAPADYSLTFKADGYETVTRKFAIQAGVNTSGDMALPPLRPQLTVSSQTLDFGTENTALTLDITNTGKGVLQWSITEDIEWLECSVISGKTEKEVSSVVLTVSRQGWAKGDYSRTLAIASNGGSTVITVNMSVTGCNLKVSPKEIDLGETESTAKLTLTNKGNGTISYAVKASNDWIGLSKTTGKVSTEDFITVTVNRGGLAAGEYSGLVTFTVGEDVVNIPVKLIISAKSRPVVSFDAVKAVAYNGAKLSGSIVSVGNTKITRYGFCWSLKEEPTITDSHTEMGDCSVPMSFEGSITDLAANTKYYVRAYAENNEGMSYSNESSFTTTGVPTLPSVQTKEAVDVKSNTVTVNGFLVNLGNVAAVVQHGHIWGISDKLDVGLATKTELGNKEEPGAFASVLTDLTPNTKYYVCAYATNEKGTAYGDILQFTTSASDMKLSTNEVTAIVHNAATCGGAITDFGGRTVSECGVCWSLKEEAVSVDDWKVTGKLEKNKWNCRLEGLTKETDYYVRAYARASDGALFYGAVRKFSTTQEVKLPTLSRVTVTGINTQSATFQSSVTNNGNSDVTACGFCWSTTQNPTIDNDNVACDVKNPSFGKKVEGLKDGTKYYVRSYATNAMGTAYSENVEFTTVEITIPVWSNASVFNIGRVKVNVTATLVSDGNAKITEMGICWATHPDASVYDEKQVCPTGSSIAAQVTGLQGTTSYYLRTYAQNSKGIAYSNEVAFTTTNSETDVWDGVSVAASFAGGIGTETDPIRIETADQLKLLESKVNAGTTYSGIYFKLTSNINLANKEWTPIGNYNNNFCGNFDGGNNSITNLRISASADYSGLFGKVSGGCLSNLKISGKIKGNGNTGMLCGYAVREKIQMIETSGTIEGYNSTGGICGILSSSATYGSIKNCINRCFVSGNGNTGGIAGLVTNESLYGDTEIRIENSVNYGEITDGCGIVGYSYANKYCKTVITNCCNYSNVSKHGITYANESWYPALIQCYWLNDVAGNFGIESGYSSKVAATDCSYFVRTSTSCTLLQLGNKDLVEELNRWVEENGSSIYRKWEYKLENGYACPVMK